MRKFEFDTNRAIVRQIKKVALAPFFNELISQRKDYENAKSIDTVNQELAKSTLGTSVFSNLIIEEGNYEDLEGNVINYATKNFRIDTVVFNINVQKNIVKTQVLDRIGTVKEHITFGDYLINAKIVLTGENGERPDSLIKELKRIMEAPVAITVTSVYLQLFDINQIVIENYTISQRQGSRNIIDFEFTASSDIPLELELLKNV